MATADGMLARSFPPLQSADAHTLVLGSMPGQASLAAQQYYAHPRNAFWPIMGRLFGAEPQLAYPLRVQRLLAARIAVWDVLGACVRPGSLDSAIRPDGQEANDFAGFLAEHPGVGRIFFNGAAAEQLFRRLVLPGLELGERRLRRLPSTSPAHAGMRFDDKLAAWQAVAAKE